MTIIDEKNKLMNESMIYILLCLSCIHLPDLLDLDHEIPTHKTPKVTLLLTCLKTITSILCKTKGWIRH
jgi:hypothetical protein